MRLDAVYFIQKEKFQELIRAAEQDDMLQQVELHKPDQTRLQRNLAAWVGVQIIKWGAKLRQYSLVTRVWRS